MDWIGRPAQSAAVALAWPVEGYIGHVRSLRGRAAAISSLILTRLYVRYPWAGRRACAFVG